MKKKGIVYLVGAGPGDPGLITLRGVQCLERADVILYDYLANPQLLKRASSKSQKIYVGKKGGFHQEDQTRINGILIAKARQGKTVVRLKGGDPFVFGRGGEEAEALASCGIPYEVVPGVTSALAAPAYAGIPLTHRDYTAELVVTTGHQADTAGRSAADWKALARMGTLVFLMGWKNLPEIVRKLAEAGKSLQTPAAMIEWGTYGHQKTVTATLESIVHEVSSENIRPPTVLVVGEVVRLRERLQWFERKTLSGRRFLVTRAREQAGELSRLLEERGGEVVEIAAIEIKPPRSWRLLDQALKRLRQYEMLIFTSANGVEAFFQRLLWKGLDLRCLSGLRIAVVGPGTADALKPYHLKADFVARDYRAEGLLKILKGRALRGRRALFVRAEEGRDVLIEGLKSFCRLDLAPAYRTVCPKGLKEALARELSGRKIDCVIFSSSSTVRNFVRSIGDRKALVPAATASIGPVTSSTLREFGLPVTIEARHATRPALVKAIEDYYSAC